MLKYLKVVLFIFLPSLVLGQSPSFKTYINPIIPGDHPDPTLTKIGNYFYTSGSSFNPTPKIYRSTNLVHWEVIAQPVSASWSEYGDSPGGGIWGGHMVFYNGKYWHFFGRGGGRMYFVTADQPEGPWSTPTVMNIPSSMPNGLGVDNSIFIDDDGKWYLLTKAGEPNNHIVELGNDGQPTGVVYNLSWLNPAPYYPYGWAEGPVMWKYNGYYYYSFAQHLVGAQYVMRSQRLTDEQSAWTIIGTNIFTGTSSVFNRPNHISPAVTLDDGTSWVIAHSYHSSSAWYAQGRQGLLCQVTYNAQGFPVIQYPSNEGVRAPNLPSNGIKWMVPKSDMFDNSTLSPNWSLLGYMPNSAYSLTERPGWLCLKPYSGYNTVIQNDGEHNYSLITKVDFDPQTTADEAGLWIINGPETHQAKVFITVNSMNERTIAISFSGTLYQVKDTIDGAVWLKLIRDEHKVIGFYSSDGSNWIQIGQPIDATAIDIQQTQFNNFTGNKQGLFVKGKLAYFDFYIYRDAYTYITAQNPANRFGVLPSTTYLGSINNNDWAMYAGIEFGGNDYKKHPISMEISASATVSGGIVEVWLDSIDTGKKIAECSIENTGGLTTFQIFRTTVDSVSANHDVYLKFVGTGTQELFRINWFRFLSENDIPTSISLPSKPQLASATQYSPTRPDIVILKWYKSENTEQYLVQMSTDATFGTISKNATISDTVITFSGLKKGTEYFWRVQASSIAGSSPWSDIWSYVAGGTNVEKEATMPLEYSLSQNYPNPFNPATTIEFSLPKSSHVELILVNILGQVVKVLASGNYSAGTHKINLNASEFSSGVYFYKLYANGYISLKKLVVMK